LDTNRYFLVAITKNVQAIVNITLEGNVTNKVV